MSIKYKIYIFFLLSVLLVNVSLFVVKIFKFKAWDRLYYSASVHAPSTTPMYVFYVSFLDEKQEEISFSSSVWDDIYSINNLHSSWQHMAWFSAHRSSPTPSFLSVSYFSYRDSSIYEETIPLPKDSIRAIFKLAKKENQEEENYSAVAKKGLVFVIGLTENGTIVLYLSGKQGFLKKVFQHDLKKRANQALTDNEIQWMEDLYLPKDTIDSLIQIEPVINYLEQPIVY